MDMFAQLDSMDAISMCGLKEEDWYIPAAKQAMKEALSFMPEVQVSRIMNCSYPKTAAWPSKIR